MVDEIVIVDGLRSPIAKANGVLNNVSADNLGAIIAKELVLKSQIPYELFDEVIIGNVAQPANAANIARIIAVKAGLPQSIPAYTVHRNCASGMQAISSAIEKIKSDQGSLYLVGGVESMSNIPLLFQDKFKDFMTKLTYSRSIKDKLSALSSFEFKSLKPIIGLLSGLTDPISGKFSK
jgi:acetyl-CoA C-acetyltransferase